MTGPGWKPNFKNQLVNLKSERFEKMFEKDIFNGDKMFNLDGVSGHRLRMCRSLVVFQVGAAKQNK
jgi:hypothetical protein